ncbi:MAG: HAMP domain-containing histidine kinase [Nitrosopumilus sp.]|nr:HAMP domain-containing histidine kinase [Nitrosopumilus sp.]MDF2423450.1 HAMP domain-containing histidine kinase [Nitrosopumilus sp.]MDF2424044.1 HAMP domain-containing histidine kinase [Nitrosopumilus sp.]MDF2425856.1 HAMP domain-containing histidine kinase [Nitrosopumilus sp.]MDF2427386.1 HAMP domain-containing histidine kinase [Nitrosopumilus sp.]
MVLIFAAVVNLVLFYQGHDSESDQSFSIIRVGDVKVGAESISGLVISVASGNSNDKNEMEQKIHDVEEIIQSIGSGDSVNGHDIVKIPSELSSEYNSMTASWESYKVSVQNTEKISVFDPEATKAMNYLLEKNNELILATNQLANDVKDLGRDYTRHKEISNDLMEYAKIIGQQTLLISIGEDTNAQSELKEKRLKFEIGVRKLLQIPTLDLNVKSVGEKHETLIQIPRENSKTLQAIDPLWESMQSKITILEERTLLSPEFNSAKNQMNSKKMMLYDNIDEILKKWNEITSKHNISEQTTVQVILVIDIVIFFIVVIMIRQSLRPLGIITNALSKVKDGIYSEIKYSGKDEVGELVTSFNIMSSTIKEKDEEGKKKDIAKDEFLAMITHELKTPLVPIQGYADILLSEHLGKLTSKQKERIAIIKSSSEALLSLISDLLDAQKLELGQLRISKKVAGISDTVSKSLENHRLEAEKNSVEIILRGENVQIEHDPERITQVVSNLIKNSIAAIGSGGGKIEVSIENGPSDVTVSVKDNGVGIAKDKQEDLFKKFYQVDTTLTRERGGSGLGLAISKGIIENHLGRIWADSEIGKGSTFSFRIPKNQSEQNKTPL